MGMEGRRFVTSFFYIFYFAGEFFFLFLAVKSGTDFFCFVLGIHLWVQILEGLRKIDEWRCGKIKTTWSYIIGITKINTQLLI